MKRHYVYEDDDVIAKPKKRIRKLPSLRTNPRASTSGILFIRNLPEQEKRSFKSYCSRRGITMNDMIVKLIRDTLKEAKMM